MELVISYSLEKERKRILKNCKKCGKCAKICPSIEIGGIDRLKFSEIQKYLYDFVTNPKKNEIVSKRIDSCLECFKCVDSCPNDINPLSYIEIAKSLSYQNEYAPYVNCDPGNFASQNRSLENELTKKESKSVLTSTDYSNKKIVFFPGCNVYNHSPRLLKTKAVLDLLDNDTAFIPGTKYCCGDRYLFDGRLQEGEEQYHNLVSEIQKYNPDTIVFWCPTCLARMKKTWGNEMNCVSFFQFCHENISKLNFLKPNQNLSVTLHEPCKTTYTKIDDSHRSVINAIPGLSLTEMASGTKCCGSGGISYFKDRTIEVLTHNRLSEAKKTGAEVLITICHYCQELFESENETNNIKIVNLIDLIHSKLEPASLIKEN
ncbi:MAG: (Fe-S)-binding protein [Deltaproteobacteria bacterium]|nr:(Fe-S)-binding protein [Deltaproteobacteria bacterium]